MNLATVLFPISFLISSLTCSRTEHPALVPTATTRLKTETITRYLPAELNNAGVNAPNLTFNQTTYRAIGRTKATYAYDAQGRLISETHTEPARATDPYGYNWTRTYTYLGDQVKIENRGLDGKVNVSLLYKLNAAGYVIADLNDPNQTWAYNADNQLIRRNTLEQDFRDGNRIRQTNLTGDVTTFSYDLAKPNPILTPTPLWWGKPDRSMLTGKAISPNGSKNTQTEGKQSAYTYELNAQGLATKRMHYQVTKPAAGYVMAQGQTEGRELEVVEYEYE